MLEVKNLFFRFENKLIFEETSFEIAEKEIVALLGPSGSGKTTLFHLITDLYQPLFGQIKMSGLSPRQAKHLFTYMMQKDLLLPWKTALDNLLILKSVFLKNHSGDPKEIACFFLKEVGLFGCEYLFPSEMSMGMRQRVCLARALFLGRKFLLLDEPFSSIDYEQKIHLYTLLQTIQKKHGLTIFLITHDLLEAKRLADRLLLLKDKKIQCGASLFMDKPEVFV